MICTCMCCSSAWPQPGGSQTACRIRHCCKLQATPRSGRFPGGSWSLSDGRDRKKHQIWITDKRLQSFLSLWRRFEGVTTLYHFATWIKKNQPCCSKLENFTGSGGLIWIEVSVILYTQIKEGNKTSSQPKGSITAADHLLRVLKKLRSGPLKAAAHRLPFEIKALSKTVGLNHLDLPAKQLLIPIFSKKKKVLRHLWFLLLSSNL